MSERKHHRLLDDYKDFILEIKDDGSFDYIADKLSMTYGIIVGCEQIRTWFKQNNIKKKKSPTSKAGQKSVIYT